MADNAVHPPVVEANALAAHVCNIPFYPKCKLTVHTGAGRQHKCKNPAGKSALNTNTDRCGRGHAKLVPVELGLLVFPVVIDRIY